MKKMEEPDNEFAKKQGLWFCSEVRLNWPACMLCAISLTRTLSNCCCCCIRFTAGMPKGEAARLVGRWSLTHSAVLQNGRALKVWCGLAPLHELAAIIRAGGGNLRSPGGNGVDAAVPLCGAAVHRRFEPDHGGVR